ncbi:cell division protein FtsB [Advenella sp. S44]|uniref:cell division protein FtsB n=1 Tax=Advenella sp. S44 TaxID=1982755 RepID=UPI000C2B2E7D|nr:cell division protein FtsB [Advenella sp. S44]PJX22097.1 cell division protein FtsB [Advenella sp. S44]
MRLLYLALMVACVAIQYPLWWGEEGWARVTVLQQQLEAQEEKNRALLARNNAMEAEVHDLKTGTDALEDRARIEMRMIKKDETYVQILTPNEPQPEVPVSYEVPGAPKAGKPAQVASKPQAKASARPRAKSDAGKPAKSPKPAHQ